MSELATRLVNLPPGYRRGLAIAVLFLVAIIMCALVWLVFSSLSESRNELFAKRALAGRLQQVAARKGSTDAQSGSYATTKDQSDYLPGDSEAVARGSLQTMLTELAATNQAEVASAGNVPDVRSDGTVYAGIRLEFSGTVEAVHAMLSAIETARPPLTIREATLWTITGYGGTEAPELFAQLKIYGAMRPQAAVAEAPAQ